MWRYLDVLLITVIVTLSAGYAIYALASIKFKRAVLTLLVKVFGVRVFMFFSPRLGGCSACSANDTRAEVLQKLKKV